MASKKKSGNTACNSEVKLYVCKRIGCCEKFKHKTQLYRHKVICSAISPRKPKKLYKKEDDHCCY